MNERTQAQKTYSPKVTDWYETEEIQRLVDTGLWVNTGENQYRIVDIDRPAGIGLMNGLQLGLVGEDLYQVISTF